MSGEKSKKKGILRFEEGIKQFMYWSEKGGISHPREFAVDIIIDDEKVGYITNDGKITISGVVTERDPSTIMSYSSTFTLEQWLEIATEAKEFKERRREKDKEFEIALKKLEDLARMLFFEDDPFTYVEIATSNDWRLIIGGGKARITTYQVPGVYVYRDTGMGVTIGDQAASAEQRVTKASDLQDEIRQELLRVAGSANVIEIKQRISAADMPDSEKAKIHPLHRLDLPPTAAEERVLTALLEGPGSMDGPGYGEACEALQREREPVVSANRGEM